MSDYGSRGIQRWLYDVFNYGTEEEDASGCVHTYNTFHIQHMYNTFRGKQWSQTVAYQTTLSYIDEKKLGKDK